MSEKALAHGEARCPGEPSTQEIIARDKVPAPGWVPGCTRSCWGSISVPAAVRRCVSA